MNPESKIHTYNGDALGAAFLVTILFLSFLTLWLSACTSTATVKKQIASELSEIAEYQDCPSTCEALKLYIKTKLGGL